MFRPLELPANEAPATLTLQVDGRPLRARQGETLAAALLAGGVVPFRRTAVSGAPRAPMCLMGVCFECVVEVDGLGSVQSCMLEVRDGMQVHLPTGARIAGEVA